MTAEALHPDAAARLGSDLAAALISPDAMEDPLRREEHSLRLRRSALLGHSSLTWLAHLASVVRLPAQPAA